MTIAQKKFIFIPISLILYLAALILPAYDYRFMGPETAFGWETLLYGFMTFDYIKESLNPFPFVAWLSNIPFFIGLFILSFSRNLRGFKRANVFLLVSFLMSLCALINYGKEDFGPNIGCVIWILGQATLWWGAFDLKRNSSAAGENILSF